MPKCHFSADDSTTDGLYQLCTCKRHAWSVRARRIIGLRDIGCFVFSDATGNRYQYWPYTRAAIARAAERRTFIIDVIASTIVLVGYAYVLYIMSPLLHAPSVPAV